MSHANALLSPKGRLLLARRVVDHGWNLRRAAKTTHDSAYAAAYTSDEARAATCQQRVHDYDHHRPHSGIGNTPPINRVHKNPGNYT
ncbi:hypothetical protein E3O44_09190 [Cryobacterium algoricola]|uniref:Integrase catalytic domain-containing protein n=1 Tax=Cryobacterium algoricola TaxID=1259183 RepID=A0ABY2ICH8_9MICO|nr:leucine zipper domain-containing protein [Cryobacterium algoricola]TFB87286.1 hypothetical protein E3O44_09190 [Cryobacterium algoricola]